MIVSCTQCENTIAIDDERIPPKGMRIRCGRCGEPLVVRGGGQQESLGPPRPPPSAAPGAAPPSDSFPYEPTPIRSEKIERSQWKAKPPEPPMLSFGGTPLPPTTGRTAFGAPGSWQEGTEVHEKEVELPPQERTLVEKTAAKVLPRARGFDLWRGPALVGSWLAGPAVAALAAFLVWTGWSWMTGADASTLRLAPHEVEARVFTDPAGRQAAFVTGRVQVEGSLAPGASIRLRAELVDGSGVVRAEAEGWAGALPQRAAIARLAADRGAWSAWLDEVATQSPAVEAGSTPFFLLFHQIPEEIGSLRARIAARAVTPAAGRGQEISLE